MRKWCRLTKIQMFSNGAKHLETEVFQLGHVMIIHGNGQTRQNIVSARGTDKQEVDRSQADFRILVSARSRSTYNETFIGTNWRSKIAIFP